VMNRIFQSLKWVLALVLGFCCVARATAAEAPSKAISTPAESGLNPAAAKELAKEAIIFGFASAEAYKAVWYGLSPESAAKTGTNMFGPTKIFTPEDRIATAPSADTAYKLAILDLRSEPVVVSVPELKGRYYSIMLADVTGNVHGYIGTRETGTGKGAYMIAPADWAGEVPPAVKWIYRVPATLVVALARFEIKDHAAFSKAFEKKTSKIRIAPYSRFLNPKAKARKAFAAIKDLPHWYDTRIGGAEGFFRTWNFVSQFQSYSRMHKPTLQRVSRIGMVPGREFRKTVFSADVWKAIEEGFEEGRALIKDKASRFGTPIDGWNWSPRDLSKYGSNYLRQSAGAWNSRMVRAMLPSFAIVPSGACVATRPSVIASRMPAACVSARCGRPQRAAEESDKDA